jgi:hypothetical protein
MGLTLGGGKNSAERRQGKKRFLENTNNFNIMNGDERFVNINGLKRRIYCADVKKRKNIYEKKSTNLHPFFSKVKRIQSVLVISLSHVGNKTRKAISSERILCITESIAQRYNYQTPKYLKQSSEAALPVVGKSLL